MGNNIKFYAFYDSWGLIVSTVTLQIRIENVVDKNHSKCKTIAACNFTAPAGILVKLDEVFFCTVIMRQLNALNRLSERHRRYLFCLRYSSAFYRFKFLFSINNVLLFNES